MVTGTPFLAQAVDLVVLLRSGHGEHDGHHDERHQQEHADGPTDTAGIDVDAARTEGGEGLGVLARVGRVRHVVGRSWRHGHRLDHAPADGPFATSFPTVRFGLWERATGPGQAARGQGDGGINALETLA